ncbi:MAG: nucleoside deaminase [Clostridia bacterium]|nr:nucleoside deaminase [Clostridia bacterium]
MTLALQEANKCEKSLDVPVGVVFVKDDKVIAKAYNKKEKCGIATYHAEILGIEKACKKVNNFRLDDVDVYVTKEPCVMCYGALLSARVRNIYFGAYDSRFGVTELDKHIKFNHKVNLVGGVLEEECSNLLHEFFEKIRK